MKHCIACGKNLPDRELFVLRDAPASAQDIPDAGEVVDDKGIVLPLYQCAYCELVQFACEPVSYYRDVIRAGGYSITMTELRRRQYCHLIETYHLEGMRFLEVGCGQGEFLKVLTEFPVDVYGMEHKEELVKAAQMNGLFVWREFPEKANQKFGSEREADLFPDGRKPPEGKFDVFLSFNFLEHQPRPDVMLQAVWNNLSEGGIGLITVPSLEYIVERGSYYELIRDHIAYYSFETLRYLLERNGFHVLEEELINRDTISMIVRKVQKKKTEACLSSDGTSEWNISNSLCEGYETVSREVDSLTLRYRKNKRRLAMWGASHQGFTLAASTSLGTCSEYIIDSAPFKQGRFAPSSHLPIVKPEEFFENPVDGILIVAPGYTEEIAAIIRERFGEGIEIMTLRSNHIEWIDSQRTWEGAE